MMKFYLRLLDFVVCLWTKIPFSIRQFYHSINTGFSFGTLFFPNRTELVTIKSGLNKGVKMRLNLNIYRDYYFGTYEKDVQSVLTKIIQKNMTVYNIGANLGFFTLALSQIVGSKGLVVAFEPNHSVRERLIEHLHLNGVEHFVQVEEFALSDFDGKAEFSLSLNEGRGRFEDLPDVKPGHAIQVPCKSLDTYISEKGSSPDVILMDVEHAEGRVLRGMTKTLKDCRPIIIIEMHSPLSIEESLEELKKHDYFLARIPERKIIKLTDKITRGHYLAFHGSYLKVLNSS